MVGFARAISDGAGFAYLADVYIDKRSAARASAPNWSPR